MAQTDDEKAKAAEQKDLFAELEQSDVKVADDAAAEMKDNILSGGGGAYLGIGVHDVFIKSIELIKAKSGTLGLKFIVENADGKNDATFWLSEAALPYTIENVSRLVVHNTADAKKDAARTFMSNITGAKELVDVAKEKLIDGVGYLSVKASATQTYTDKDGNVKPSLEKSLLAWRPKETPAQSAATVLGGGEPVNPSELPF